MDEMRAFLAPEAVDAPSPAAPGFADEDGALIEALSPRELDVLRHAAHGRTNEEIAAALGLSARTVERHLSNAYGKLGITGKAARAGAVAALLRRGLA
jgi:DNA-binding NarL/FixJ family response regulator